MERATNAQIASLKKQKRENKSLLFLDNAKIIKDALASGKIEPICVLSAQDELPFVAGDVPVYRVDAKTIAQFSSAVTDQGVICVAKFLMSGNFDKNANSLILDGLQDPGNVGTLVRTALASGFSNVIMIDGVNPSNEKLIRSSAGAIFSVNLAVMSRESFETLAKRHEITLVCTDMSGQNVFELDRKTIKKPIGVVVGNEGQGVSKVVEKLCDLKVSIPMRRGIESLNAAVSGAIVMYQLSEFAG